MKRIIKIDNIKFDRSIEYARDTFNQKKKYKKIEADTIGKKGVIEYLRELGDKLLQEGGFDSPEFENFEKFEEEVRNRILE